MRVDKEQSDLDTKLQKKPKTIKKAVVLLSGGMDSVTTLYLVKRHGYVPYALIFDYNQRHSKEIHYALKIARLNKVHYYIIKVSFPWTQSALTKSSIKIPFGRNLHGKDIPVTYVSGRNIIFLSYAASFAESINARKIFIGAHVEDYSGYPDCRPEFLKAMKMAVNEGIARKGVDIVAPLIKMSKRDIVKLGIKLGVPFEYTWSCYTGNKYPCEKCDSCRFRMQAFESLGMIDPLLKKARRKNR